MVNVRNSGMETLSVDEVKSKVGQYVTTSRWRTVDQVRIDAFAEVTEDHQFIHIDPEAAARTPFGETIAHGFLTLSLLSSMASEQILTLEGMSMGINYGFDKVRFVCPVRSGKRIRGCFALTDFKARRVGEYMFTYDVRVDIEGEDKPALVAQWLTVQVVASEVNTK